MSLRGKLSVHHIGARGPTQAFPDNPAFDASVVNVLYEADPECIAEVRALNAGRKASVVVLNECISGSGGERTFCDAHHGYGSSLLEANGELRGLYIPAHWIDYDYTVHEAISARARRTVATRTLDEVARERDIPLPDFLSLDTQGSELEILLGSPLALASALCVVSEVEFVPLYEDQPLFGDVCAFMASRGFFFARFFRFLDGSMHRAPLGLRGAGFPVTTDALFLRDPRTVADSPERGLRLAKLAFLSLQQGFLDHAAWSLREAGRHDWMALAIDEPWFRFLQEFAAAAARVPRVMPDTYFEHHGQARRAEPPLPRQFEQAGSAFHAAAAEVVALLRRHGLDEAAEAARRQTAVDLKRLGLPEPPNAAR